jgi:hypothetical protein
MMQKHTKKIISSKKKLKIMKHDFNSKNKQPLQIQAKPSHAFSVNTFYYLFFYFFAIGKK